MWRRRSSISLLVATAALTLGAASASAATPTARLGTPAAIPSSAHATGLVTPSAVIHATVTLAPRDAAALAGYVRAVSTRGSNLYHQYLTVAQFAQRFGPTTADVATVRTALRHDGLTLGRLSADGLSFGVSAPAATIDRAFAVTLNRYSLPNGQTGYAPTRAPAVTPALASRVQGVLGLNTLVHAKPISLERSRAHAQLSPDATPQTSPASPCSAASNDSSEYGSYTPNELASAYNFDGVYSGGDYGAGTTVALYELEPYLASDISAYQSCMGTDVAVTNTKVDGGAGSGAGEGEAALDIEDVAGLAPGASINIYSGPNSASGAYDTYSAIVSADTAKVVSTSWGLCESSEGSSAANSENTLFEEAASQGQSIFAAAGDSGADDCQTGSGRAVDDPASQPDVTGVGGTTLPSDTDAAGQTVWNDGSGGGAGGGGVSSLWPKPSYQSGFAISQSSVSCGSGGTTCREVPDVSADADEDTGYTIYYDGSWTAIGGTSAAAPLWAALTALADSSCSSPVGLANPALYGAASSNYSADFDDVTSGNNSYDGVSGYSAGSGYDMASGLGTPNAGSLVPALCG